RPLHRLASILLVGFSVGYLGTVPAWAQAGIGASQPGTTISAGGEEVTVVADQLQQVGGTSELMIAVGNVEIVRGQTRLLADRVEINRDTGQAIAQGKVVFYDGPDRLVGDRIDYNLKTGTGVVYHGSATSAPFYHLTGERMDRTGESIYQVRGGAFTTCEGDEPAWSFHFGSGTADLDDMLSGRDASFWVKSVPLLPWFPYFAAASRKERQTGFLFPEFGQSSRRGYFAKIPFYWVINDSQDLTLSLDTFSARGVGLESEYRYVWSRDQRGTLGLFGINEVFRENRPPDIPENRGWTDLRHDWRIAPGLTFKVDSQVTSDDQIYRDYADRLTERSRLAAVTNVSLTKTWTNWNLLGQVRWYQDLTTLRPLELQRVPEIDLAGVRQQVPGVPWLLYETGASFVNFIREVDGPEGVRADFHPRFFVPIPIGGYLTVTPFAGGRLTYYDQRVTGFHTGLDGILTQASVYDPRVRQQIEGGVELQSKVARVYQTDGVAGIAAIQHSIEPRAQFIEIRGYNQKSMPTYDPGYNTGTGIDPGYERAHGIDRLGKANEVTYYLTNVLRAKTVAGPGQEAVRWDLMRFTLSQTYNFKPIDQPVGDLFADLQLQPNQRIRIQGYARYNMYGLGLREAAGLVGVVYPRFSAMFGPRFNEQGQSVTFGPQVAPLGPQRTLVGETRIRVLPNLDIKTGAAWEFVNATDTVEYRAGIDWRFDCWSLSALYINRHNGESEFRFQVNLLGVGQVGTSARPF
ncbi:MAG TPA: LPS assembly protein LptD, partial [Methylomirabilota bacterium]